MSVTKHLIVYVWLCIACVTSYSQTSDSCNRNNDEFQFLQKWVGEWVGVGNITGEPVVYAVNANWVLDSQFIALHLVDTAAVPAYEANIYFGFDCNAHQFVVHWIDNFGPAFSQTLGYGHLTGNVLPLYFNYPDGAFLNTFTYHSTSDTWTSVSTFQTAEKQWVSFGDITFTKKSN